ncbi:MAG: DUF262 domain-containing protein, partial [Alphaproteobacteria bacterium]|nr:DUF262 domain-containing protein [Alphaproteobacteria bacterium]
MPLREITIRDEKRNLADVLRRIDRGFINLDPDFQRDFVWLEDKQSKLIESIIMRIPLPVFYFAENDDSKLVVVDGLQRLSTIRRFAKDELSLKLGETSELHKKKFSDLSYDLQNRFEDCQLMFFIIPKDTPLKARLD